MRLDSLLSMQMLIRIEFLSPEVDCLRFESVRVLILYNRFFISKNLPSLRISFLPKRMKRNRINPIQYGLLLNL